MSNKSYQQYCGIATALDRVGDRWTLLILRELWLEERRFTDLRRALPGIAPNLLADRLRQLEHDSLVEQRELPAPAARTVYRLTDEGLRVVPVLRALARFGLPFLADPEEGRVQPRMAVHGTLSALFDAAGAAGRDLLVRFDMEGEEQWLQVQGGELLAEAERGVPDVTVAGSPAGLVAVCRRGPAQTRKASGLRVEGRASAKRLLGAMFPVLATSCN
jgi:DNA-binding HxlR family transcriptional regulator